MAKGKVHIWGRRGAQYLTLTDFNIGYDKAIDGVNFKWKRHPTLKEYLERRLGVGPDVPGVQS